MRFKLLLVMLFGLMALLLPGSPLVDAADAKTRVVCLIIRNTDGEIVTGEEISGTKFVIPGDKKYVKGKNSMALPTTEFTAPLTLDKDVLEDYPGKDAQCVTHQIPDKTAGYGQIQVTPNNPFVEYKYNDQHTVQAKNLNDFFAFSTKNGNADGNIDNDKDLRTLLVWAQYKIENPGSPPPTASPSAGPRKLVKVEIAENSDFSGGNVKTLNTPFVTDPNITSVVSDFKLADKTPGKKFLWVRYTSSDNTTEVIGPVAIELVLGDPKITNLTCTQISNSEMSIVITGDNFGAAPGKLENNGEAVTVDPANWQQDEAGTGTIRATAANSTDVTTCKVKVTRFDSKFDEATADVNTSQISLRTKYICPVVAQVGRSNVQMEVFDESGKSLHRENVRIDQNGNIQGLTLRLVEGERYTAALKVPKGLKRYVSFVASDMDGNTRVLSLDLPIGDLFPEAAGDGAINNFDFAVIKQQWGVERTATKSADFNDDNKVNSIDYSCALTSYGTDDPVPDWANVVYEGDDTPAPTATPATTPDATTSASPTAEASATPSPSPTPTPVVTPSPTPN